MNSSPWPQSDQAAVFLCLPPVHVQVACGGMNSVGVGLGCCATLQAGDLSRLLRIVPLPPGPVEA
jgi:hypothetical protein